MSPTTQGLIVFVVTLLMLVSGIPVAFGLGAIALAVLPVAVRSFRNVPIFLLVAMPAIVTVAKPLPPTHGRQSLPPERTAVNAAMLGVAGLIGLPDLATVGTVLTGGAAGVPLSLPSGLAGQVFYLQAGALDATQSHGVALSNGLRITVGS